MGTPGCGLGGAEVAIPGRFLTYCQRPSAMVGMPSRYENVTRCLCALHVDERRAGPCKSGLAFTALLRARDDSGRCQQTGCTEYYGFSFCFGVVETQILAWGTVPAWGRARGPTAPHGASSPLRRSGLLTRYSAPHMHPEAIRRQVQHGRTSEGRARRCDKEEGGAGTHTSAWDRGWSGGRHGHQAYATSTVPPNSPEHVCSEAIQRRTAARQMLGREQGREADTAGMGARHARVDAGIGIGCGGRHGSQARARRCGRCADGFASGRPHTSIRK